MAGVAYDTSVETESTKSGYVTYDIYTWQQTAAGYCAAYDPNDSTVCINYVPATYDWVYSGTGSTGAKINGSVSATSTVYVNGKPIATVGSTTNETWVASPPVPSDTGTTQYRNVSPGTSGSGSGSVSGGNLSSIFVGVQQAAIIGSQVTTSLGNTTTVQTGSANVFIG